METDVKRHAVNAISNARKAIACLVNWYLISHHFMSCRNPPNNAREKSHILKRLGIYDEITALVLEKAIEKRDVVEHQFQSIPLDEAANVVELIRRTSSSIMHSFPPGCGPACFGTLTGGVFRNYAENIIRGTFYGWSNPIVLIAAYEPRKWIGIVLPESPSVAHVRYTMLSRFSSDELFLLYSKLNYIPGRDGSWRPEEDWREHARVAGLQLAPP